MVGNYLADAMFHFNSTIMVTIQRKEFGLYEISKENHESFFKSRKNSLSECECWMLKTLRAIISEDDKNVEMFWRESECRWFCEHQTTEKAIFLTDNGIAMLYNYTTEKLYRIEFF